jgi:uncharacterized membrane protein HdeD (DUF308 family)
MKPAAFTGILLIIIGVVSLAYQGFTYTTREKAVDLGPLQITTEKTHTIPFPPIFGALALVGGVVLVVAAKR